MIKTATVSRDMKQYRRALQAFHRGDDYAFHGTSAQNQSGLLQAGRIYPNRGVHGSGAYFSSRQPSQDYWTHNVGVIVPIEKAREQGARVLETHRGIEPWLLARQGYGIGAKDLFVHAPEHLTPGELRAAQMKYHIRPIDTGAYLLAEMAHRGYLSPNSVANAVRNPRSLGAKGLAEYRQTARGMYSDYINRYRP